MSIPLKVLLFSMLLSIAVAVAQYGSSAPLPPQVYQSHRPPPPLFGGKVPKKQKYRPFTGSVPIFRPDGVGLGPLPVPSGPGPLPLPSGIGPLPLPAGPGPMPVPLASPSYYYGNPLMDGFSSPFQQVSPSFQPQRPFQTAPSSSYGTAQPMNYAPQQTVPPSSAPPIYLHQSTSSFGSIPSKFLSPPPPSTFLTPISFGGPASPPVFPGSSSMLSSFAVTQPTQYNQMQSYANGQMQQQGADAPNFGPIPQREQTQQFTGPNPYSPPSYGSPQQFAGSDSSPLANSAPQPTFVTSGFPFQSFGQTQQPFGPFASSGYSSVSHQSYGQASPPQSFAPVAPQQSFSSAETQQSFVPTDSQQSFRPSQQSFSSAETQQSFVPTDSQQSFRPSQQSFGQASFEQPSGPSQSFSPSSQQQSYGTASSSFSPVESQQQTFDPAESQQFVPITTSQSFAPSFYGPSNGRPSPTEGLPVDMQSSGVPIFGVPPPSQQVGSSSEFQQGNLQDSSIRQPNSPDFLLSTLYQSAALIPPPPSFSDSASSGPGSSPTSGSTFDDTSSLTTKYVRVRN